MEDESVVKLSLVLKSKPNGGVCETHLDIEGDVSPETVSNILDSVGVLITHISSPFPRVNHQPREIHADPFADEIEELNEELPIMVEASDSGWCLHADAVEGTSARIIPCDGTGDVNVSVPVFEMNDSTAISLKNAWNNFGIIKIQSMGNSSSTYHCLAFPPVVNGQVCLDWGQHDFPVCSCPSYKYKSAPDMWCKHTVAFLQLTGLGHEKDNFWAARPENLPECVARQVPAFKSG
jgi:hypothetical protein